MRFSLLTLVLLTALAGCTFAAIHVSGLFYIFLRFVTLISVLAAIITAIYANDETRAFPIGWALCTGTILCLLLFRINLVGIYLQSIFPDPGMAGVVDIDLSIVAGYAGGHYAQALSRNAALTASK